MKKKLLTLAVAAAVAAPALASAEAIMYGRLNMSIDYQDIDYADGYSPWYNNSATNTYAGDDYFVNAAGQVSNVVVPTGTALTAAQAEQVRGYMRMVPGARWNGQDFKGWSVNRGPNLMGSSRANRLGVKGSEDLGNGLKAIYQIEFAIAMANETDENLVNGDRSANSSPIQMRNSFVGLAGDWGTFLVGRHDTPLKISTSKLDLFSDTMADYNGTVGFQDLRADNTITYVSPSWAGFQLAAAIVPGGGATGGFGGNINSDSIGEAYSLAGIYSNGPFYASVAYENLGQQVLMDSDTSLLGAGCQTIVQGGTLTSHQCARPMADDDWTKYRIGLGLLDWNGFTLTGIYEHHDLPQLDNQWAVYYGQFQPLSFNFTEGMGGLWGGSDTADLWQIQAGYAFGNFMVKAMYGEMNRDGSYTLPNYASPLIGQASNTGVYAKMAKDYYKGTRSTWAIGADYNFSKRTKAYVLYTDVSDDRSGQPLLLDGDYVPTYIQTNNVTDWNGFSLGIVHKF